MKKQAKRMGRPPKPLDQKFVDVGLKLPPAMLEQIDSMVSVEIGVDRSTAIRQLLAEALAARTKKGGR